MRIYRFNRLATAVLVGTPLTCITGCEVVFVYVRRQTSVVTEVYRRPTVLITVADADWVVVENPRFTVHTLLISVGRCNGRGHIRGMR